MTPRLLFYVQHLLGVGHVFRALRIARACVQEGLGVRLVLGGGPVPDSEIAGLDVVHLPTIKAGPEGFQALVQDDGRPLDDAFRDTRRAQLLAIAEVYAPDIVLIEAFPFARRQMRFELIPLLEAISARRPRPLVVSSIRDILQESAKPSRAVEACDTLRAYFDRVVVHGDPALIRLEATFPAARDIDGVHYSGLVAPERGSARSAETFDVIVSAGGGAVGADLLATAIAAKPLTPLADARWLALTGRNVPADAAARLSDQARKAGVTLRPFLAGLVDHLAAARLSISQAGYNTVADLLVARCRSVLVPYVGAGETEQTRRAALLEARGLAVAVAERDLTPERLAAAIARACDQDPARHAIDLDGAGCTARLLSAWARARAG